MGLSNHPIGMRLAPVPYRYWAGCSSVPLWGCSTDLSELVKFRIGMGLAHVPYQYEADDDDEVMLNVLRCQLTY